ncbi:MAG: hypothetical protein WDO74_15505 [Pseudomonadota bacterium]
MQAFRFRAVALFLCAFAVLNGSWQLLLAQQKFLTRIAGLLNLNLELRRVETKRSLRAFRTRVAASLRSKNRSAYFFFTTMPHENRIAFVVVEQATVGVVETIYSQRGPCRQDCNLQACADDQAIVPRSATKGRP